MEEVKEEEPTQVDEVREEEQTFELRIPSAAGQERVSPHALSGSGGWLLLSYVDT